MATTTTGPRGRASPNSIEMACAAWPIHGWDQEELKGLSEIETVAFLKP